MRDDSSEFEDINDIDTILRLDDPEKRAPVPLIRDIGYDLMVLPS